MASAGSAGGLSGGAGPSITAVEHRGIEYVGPLASRAGGRIGSDFSVFVGLIAGGVVYYLLAGRSVRAEGAATPAAI